MSVQPPMRLLQRLNMGWIYKITNSVNSKVYIGQTYKSIKERWRGHKYAAFHPGHISYNSAIYKAIRKHGWENFKIEPIEECSQDKLDEREMYWIEKYDSYGRKGYNSTRGGHGYRIYDEDMIKSLWDKGYNLRRICRELDICVNTVKSILEDYPPFIKQRYQRYLEASSDKSYESKPVKQYSLNGDYIATFPSLAEAERQTGTDKSTIMRVCKGKSVYANNYQWRYVDDDFAVTKVETHNIPILQTDKDNTVVKEFNSIAEAARDNGLSKSMVTYSVKNERMYKGYYWRRKEVV